MTKRLFCCLALIESILIPFLLFVFPASFMRAWSWVVGLLMLQFVISFVFWMQKDQRINALLALPIMISGALWAILLPFSDTIFDFLTKTLLVLLFLGSSIVVGSKEIGFSPKGITVFLLACFFMTIGTFFGIFLFLNSL